MTRERFAFSGISEELAARAEPLVYRTNVFRLLQLPTTVTLPQIQRRLQELEMWRHLGITAFSSGIFPPSQPPDEATLQATAHRLQDPLKRLVEELFWFWSTGPNEDDEALTALKQQNIGNAIALWQQMADRGSDAQQAIAQHNLAVLYHLMALELELKGDYNRTPKRRQWEDYWHKAWTFWNKTMDTEATWDYLNMRVSVLDDPRLDWTTVEGFQTALPFALALINSQLALRAAQNDEESVCQMHRDLLAEFVDEFVAEEALERVAKPLCEELRTFMQTARQNAERQPPAKVAEWLLTQAQRIIPTLTALLSFNHPTLQTVQDEVALHVRNLANASVKEGDAASLETTVRLLKAAADIAGSPEMKKKLSGEAIEVEQVLRVTPIMKELTALLKDAQAKSGYWAMDDAERLLNKAEPLLKQLDASLTGDGKLRELKVTIHDAVAVQVHRLVGEALKASNRDLRKAKALLKRAWELASSRVKSILETEMTALDSAIARQQEWWTERVAGCGCLIVLGLAALILVLAGQIWWFTATRQITPPAPPPLPRPQPTPLKVLTFDGRLGRKDERRTYRVEVVSSGQTLEAELDGPQGADFDLYIRRGQPPVIKKGEKEGKYDALGFTEKPDEFCKIENARLGDYYIMVHSYQGSGKYSLSVRGAIRYKPEPPPPPKGLTFDGRLEKKGEQRTHRVEVISSGQTLVTRLDGPDGADFDLYIRRGQPPTTERYDVCDVTTRPDGFCKIKNAQPGIYYIMVHSYQGSGRYSVRVELR